MSFHGMEMIESKIQVAVPINFQGRYCTCPGIGHNQGGR